jgi:hypothetical protein
VVPSAEFATGAVGGKIGGEGAACAAGAVEVTRTVRTTGTADAAGAAVGAADTAAAAMAAVEAAARAAAGAVVGASSASKVSRKAYRELLVRFRFGCGVGDASGTCIAELGSGSAIWCGTVWRGVVESALGLLDCAAAGSERALGGIFRTYAQRPLLVTDFSVYVWEPHTICGQTHLWDRQ